MAESRLKEQFSREDMLTAIQCIPIRAETQPEEVNTLESFVQIIDFDALSGPNAQILYGRNGTGKTHLLRAYYLDLTRFGGHPKVWRQSLRKGSPYAEPQSTLPRGV